MGRLEDRQRRLAGTSVRPEDEGLEPRAVLRHCGQPAHQVADGCERDGLRRLETADLDGRGLRREAAHDLAQEPTLARSRLA